MRAVDETGVVARMNGELVVWEAVGHLAFEQLQNRLARRGAGAVEAARHTRSALEVGRQAGLARHLPRVVGSLGPIHAQPEIPRPR
jgi:hypothetical protein